MLQWCLVWVHLQHWIIVFAALCSLFVSSVWLFCILPWFCVRSSLFSFSLMLLFVFACSVSCSVFLVECDCIRHLFLSYVVRPKNTLFSPFCLEFITLVTSRSIVYLTEWSVYHRVFHAKFDLYRLLSNCAFYLLLSSLRVFTWRVAGESISILSDRKTLS